MRGLNIKIKSNRQLAKRFKRLNQIDFCTFDLKHIAKISCLRKFPFDLHDLYAKDDNYVYRACSNETENPFDSIDRIKYNPNPKCISRANVIGQGIAYYACAPDIAIIEGCQDNLRNSDKREFTMTLSKWKIKKNLIVQIICNSQRTQNAGTDIAEYCNATNRKRKNELAKKHYRTYFLKTRFLADQYAKTNIKCEQKDYYISALHSKTVLNPNNQVDGMVYPSVGYLYFGFNYAFPLRVFDEAYFELNEVSQIEVVFDRIDYKRYPTWEVIRSTTTFDKDRIIWK